MNAVEIDQTGGPETLKCRQVSMPEPQEGQILIKVEFSGVNYIDTCV